MTVPSDNVAAVAFVKEGIVCLKLHLVCDGDPGEGMPAYHHLGVVAEPPILLLGGKAAQIDKVLPIGDLLGGHECYVVEVASMWPQQVRDLEPGPVSHEGHGAVE